MHTAQKIYHFVTINKKFVLFILLPVLILSVFVYLSFRKPKPQYDALNNPVIEQLRKEQAAKIKAMETEVTMVKEELRDKTVSDSILELSLSAEIARLKIKSQNNKPVYEKKRIDIINSDVDETVNGLRERLSSKDNSK